MTTRKKYLVTGGAGFLGVHLVNKLHQRGHDVISVDIAPHDAKEYPENLPCYTKDIRDRDFEEILIGRDIVIHCAAALPAASKKEIYSVNVSGTRNVLDACLKHNIERVVFISSSGVYGLPKKNPIEETDHLVGMGPYATTKIIAEGICREFKKKGLCIPIIRAKTIVGIGRLGAFQILFDWIQSGKKIPIIGNGQNRYQLVHVDDLIEAIILASNGEANLVNTELNVGAKVFSTVAEDVGALCRYASSGATILRTPAWPVQKILRLFEIMRLSPLYQWFYESANKDSFVSIEKIEKLGWRSQKSNQDCLIETYQWYLDHADALQTPGMTSKSAWKQGVLRIAKAFL